MRLVHLAVAALLVALAIPAMTADADTCDPYPIGRCGAYQREAVTFCFDAGVFTKTGQYASPTDGSAIVVGTDALPALPAAPPVTVPQKDVAYLRLSPALAFANDPINADLPFGTLWQETNLLPGLQPHTTECATFKWFAECHPPQWMGPFGPTFFQPDTVLA